MNILRDSNRLSQKSVLIGLTLAMKQLVQVSTPANAVYVLMFLTECLCVTDHFLLTAEAHLAIPSLADRLGISPRQLLYRNRQIICKVMVDAAKDDNLNQILTHASEVFRESSHCSIRRYREPSEDELYAFTATYKRHLLPAVITKCAIKGVNAPFNCLINCVRAEGLLTSDAKEPVSLLIDNFQDILSYVVFFYPVSVQEKTLQYVAEVTGKHLVDIRRYRIQVSIFHYSIKCWVCILFCIVLLTGA